MYSMLQALYTSETLTSLNLANNQIKSGTAAELAADAIASSKALLSVDLSRNRSLCVYESQPALAPNS